MLQRRDALKIIGFGALAGSLANADGAQKNIEQNSDIKAKIAILGAGLGGISLSAKLRKELPNAQITLFDKKEIFHYEPGFTLIGIGFYQKSDVEFAKADYIPDGVKWVKQNVKELTPEQNTLILDNNESFSYDYLIIASGVEYDFSAIDGLSEDDINDESVKISTIYTLNGAIKTNKLMENFANNGGKAVFAEPRTPMKCSGANKKMFFMSHSRAKNAGNLDKCEVELFCGGASLFADPTYAGIMQAKASSNKMPFNLRHQIVAIDKAKSTATFEFWTNYKENGEQKTAKEYKEVKFDWLHFTPTQKASEIFIKAGLSTSKLGFVDVDKQTLQSTKYKNIFAIGDVINTAMGKTGASIRKMYPLLTQNIISQIKGESLSAKYDGYTACPFLSEYGKAIMVEFNWQGTASSMPCFGATRESYMNWLIKLYGFKPMVMYGMLAGRV